jgi:hypothetical protein
MKIVILIAALGGVALVAYFMLKKKAPENGTPQGTPQGTPSATPYGSFNPYDRAPIASPPAPTNTPVSILTYPYIDMAEREAATLASRPNSLAAARMAANAPARAFELISDPVAKNFIQNGFSILGNPLDNQSFKLPSKYSGDSISGDVTKIKQNIGQITSLQQFAADMLAAQNPAMFKILGVDIYPLVKTLKVRALLPQLTTFLNNLLSAQNELDAAIFAQAARVLKARGYKFIEYP